MNTKQLAIAQSVTSQQWIKFNVGTIDGDMVFSKIVDDDHCVILFGSNQNTKWFEKTVFVTIQIGKRGGIKSKVSAH